MPDGARVSVLVTVYNAAPYLGEALDSALGQTHRPVEVVVVDDGSDDGSTDIARGYGDRVRFHRMSERSGIGAARNQAVATATGEFLTFLDADDRFPPTKLAVQLAAFDADPSLEVVYGHVREFVSPELTEQEAARIRPAVPRSPSHLSGVMLIRRSAFDKVGPWRVGLKVGTGVEWYARSVERRLTTALLDDILLERRIHTANNGLREAGHRAQYLSILKAAIDRRKAAGDA